MNNKAYRVIWNDQLGTYVAVPEFASAKGKSSGAVVAATASCLATFFMQSAWAGTAAADARTQVYSGLNGVPVVDIATANGAGLSHNQYQRFNVDTNGLVLNNNASVNPIQSQLAGQVERNLNLNKAATLILNEVVTQSRSALNGYMEVAGSRADVVVANPWGITCSGCGFINTDRATLTTGVPTVGADGSLYGFKVNQGDVQIVGSGIDGKRVNILDIVARSVVLDGQVHGNDLKLVVGNNAYSYATRTATADTPSDSALAYAIDSTLLGGMYAQKIGIIATEKGVGVRMRGDVAASGSDFTLSAEGKVQVQSKISAAQDVLIASNASGDDALHLNASSVTAQRDVHLEASTGQIHLHDGALHAEQDLLLQAHALVDSSSGNAQRFAQRSQTWNITADTTIDGAQYGSGSRFKWLLGNLTVGAQGASIYSGSNPQGDDRGMQLSTSSGDLSLQHASVLSAGDLTLDAQAGEVSLGSAGRVQAEGGLSIGAATAIRNAGSVQSAQDMAIHAWGEQTQLINSGTLQAHGHVALGTQGSELGLENQGTLLAGGDLRIDGLDLRNAGTIQATQSTTITAQNLENTVSTAKWLLNTEAGNTATLTLANNLSNAGTLQNSGDLHIHAQGVVRNAGDIMAQSEDGQARALSMTAQSIVNSGHMQASGDAAITALAAAGTSIANSGQIHARGTQLTLSTKGGLIENTAGAKVLADQALQLLTSAASAGLRNAGHIQSLGAMTIGTEDHLLDVTNSGADSVLLTAHTMSMTAGEVTNEGTLQAQTASDVAARSVSNAGQWITSTASDSADRVALAGRLSNSGTLQSANDLTVLAHDVVNGASATITSQGSTAINTTATAAEGIDNAGDLYSAGALDLRVASNVRNTGSVLTDAALTLDAKAITNSGTVQAQLGTSVFAESLTNSGHASVFTASLQADHSGTLTLSHGLDNQGTLQSAGSLQVDAQNSAIENSGTIYASGSEGTLLLRAEQIINHAGAIVQGNGTATLTAEQAVGNSMENSGTIYSKGSLVVAAAADIQNAEMAQMLSDATLQLQTQADKAALNNAGRIQSLGAMTLGDAEHRFELTNAGASSVILTEADLTVEAVSMANQGLVQAKTGSTLVASSLLNDGKLIMSTQAGSDGYATVTGTLTNTGTLQSAADLTLDGNAITNSGKLLAGDALTLTANQLVNAANGVIKSEGTSTVHASATTGNGVDNAGDWHSVGALDVKAEADVRNAGTWLTDAVLTLDAKAVSNSGTVQAQQGTALTADQLSNEQGAVFTVSVQADKSGTLKVSQGLDNQGTVESANSLVIDAQNSNVDNSGTIYASGLQGALSLTANQIVNHAGAIIQGNGSTTLSALQATGHSIDNSGTIYSKGSLVASAGADIQNAAQAQIFSDHTLLLQTQAATAALKNSGRIQSLGAMTLGDAEHRFNVTNTGTGSVILSENDLLLDAGSLSNQGLVQAKTGTTLNTNSLSNEGQLITSTQAGADGHVTITGELINQGSLVSAGDLELDVTGNVVTNSGKVVAGGDLALTATKLVNTASGAMKSEGASVIHTSAATGNGIENAGDLYSVGAMDLNVTADVFNSGKLLTDSTLTIDAQAFQNRGTTQSIQTGVVHLSNGLVNDGKLQSAAGLLIDAQTSVIQNNGTIVAGGSSQSLDLDAYQIVNAEGASIQGHGVMTLHASKNTGNSIDNSGTIHGQGSVSVTAAADIQNAATARLLSNAALQLHTQAATAALNNAGHIQSLGAMTLGAVDHTFTLTNQGAKSLILSDANLLLSAGAIANEGTIQAKTGSTVTGSSLLNSGTLTTSTMPDAFNPSVSSQSEADGALMLSGDLTNTGTLRSAGGLMIDVGAHKVVNSGQLLAKGMQDELHIQAAQLTNGEQGEAEFDEAAEGVSVATGEASAAQLYSQGALTLNIGGDLRNSGKLFADQSLALSAEKITNKGVVQAQQGADVNAHHLHNSGKTSVFTASLSSSQDATLTLLEGLVNEGTLQSAAGLVVDAKLSDIDNSGTIFAAGADGHLDLDGKQIKNAVGAVIQGNGFTTLDASMAAGDSIENRGIIQGKGGLEITASANILNAENAQLLSNAAMQLHTKSLKADLNNFGRIQSLGAMHLGQEGERFAFNNAGTKSIVLSNDVLLLNASSITNEGKVQAKTGSLINGDDLVNKGEWITSTVPIASNSEQLTENEVDGHFKLSGDLNNTGTLQSGGGLKIDAASSHIENAGQIVVKGAVDSLNINAEKLSNHSKAFIKSAGVNVINVGDGGIDNQGNIVSDEGIYLVSDSVVVNGGAENLRALIIANQSGKENLSAQSINALNIVNYGSIHSNDSLNITSFGVGGILNQAGSGVSSLKTVALNSGASADISNHGAIYGGQGVKISNAQEFVNYGNGTVDSDGSFESSTKKFKNYGTVRGKNLTFNTSDYFYNGIDVIPTIEIDYSVQIDSVQNEEDHVIATDGTGSCGNCDGRWLREDAVTYKEVMIGSLPDFKPQILGNDSITVNYGAGTASNLAGTISSKKIDITGTGTFTNEDFYLEEVTFWRRSTTYEDNPLVGSSDWYYWAPRDLAEFDNALRLNNSYGLRVHSRAEGFQKSYKKEKIRVVYEKTTAGIYAGELNFSTGTLINRTNPGEVVIKKTSKNDDTEVGVNSGNVQEVNGKSGTDRSSASSESIVDRKSDAENSSAEVVLEKSIVQVGNKGEVIKEDGAQSKEKAKISVEMELAIEAKEAQEAKSGHLISVAAIATAQSKPVVAVEVLKSAGTLELGSFNVSFPSSPNGYFVPAENPQSNYLVETNPRFMVGSVVMGSKYLEERLGFSPETNMKRLGDSNYEAYLVRQQLINETGRNVLSGHSDEAAQIQSMLDQAAKQSSSLKLVYGVPLTETQVAGLTSDIVWMEVVNVGGVNVLAPRVYLSAATKAMITGGATIEGEHVSMNVASLENTGGTIIGSTSLDIESDGDITNTSAAIKGGDVSLTSVSGSIINQTLATSHGDSWTMATEIGRTSTIESTGALSMKAAENIEIIGANVASGSDLLLEAGGAITVDTIVDKSTQSAADKSTSSTKSSSTNIGSAISAGGALSLSSSQDITIAGSAVDAQSLTVETEGDLNILARQDTTTSHTTKKKSGFGVGGGLYGTEVTTTDTFTSTSSGSSLTIAGDASIQTAGTTTLQGSSMDIGGDADISAQQGLQIVDAENIERSTTVTETTTFLKFTSGSDSSSSAGAWSKASSSAESESDSGAQSEKRTHEAQASASASAEAYAGAGAGAKAEASNDSSLRLMEKTTTTEKSSNITSVGSSLNVGGSLKADTDGTLKIKGSSISADGDVDLSAKNVEVLAGRNESSVSKDTSVTSIGFYLESSAGAQAKASAKAQAEAQAESQAQASAGQQKVGALEGAQASANASASASASASANAAANASAQAESTLTIGAMHEQEHSSEHAVTHASSTIQSGGNMRITAKQDATFVGAQVDSGGDLEISAENITNQAAQDTYEKRESSRSDLAGFYIGAAAEATVDAQANLKAEVQAEVQAQAGTSATTVGGVLVHQQTDIQGSGSASAEASADASASAEAEAEITAGIRYKNEQSSEVEGSITQVTNTFTAKGSITRTAKDTIIDQGTSMEAGGNIDQSARVIKDEAVSDVEYSSSSDQSHDARIGAYLGGKAGAEAKASAKAEAKAEGKGSLSDGMDMEEPEAQAEAKAGAEASFSAGVGVKASYTGSMESESSYETTAVTSRYKAGGNVSSTSQEKTTFIGTEIEAGGDVSLAAGELDYQAAQDTSKSASSAHDIDAQATVRVYGAVGADISAEYEGEEAGDRATAARVGSIQSGGNVKITTAGDATFEGTSIESAEKTAVNAGGDVNFNAATSTADSSSHEMGLNLDVSATMKSFEGEAEAGYDMSISTGTTAEGSTIKAGTGIEINSGKSVTLEGVDIESDGDVSVSARDEVNLKAAVSTESSVGLSFAAEAKGKFEEADGSDDAAKKNADTKAGEGAKDGDDGKSKQADSKSDGVKTNASEKSDTSDKKADEQEKSDEKKTEKSNKWEGEKKASASKKVSTKDKEEDKKKEAEADQKSEEPQKKAAEAKDSQAGEQPMTAEQIEANEPAEGEPATPAEGGEAGDQKDAAGKAQKEDEEDEDDDDDKPSAKMSASLELSTSAESKSTTISSKGKITIKAGTVINQEAELSGAQGTSIIGKEVKKVADNGTFTAGLGIELSAEKGAEKSVDSKQETKPGAAADKPEADGVKVDAEKTESKQLSQAKDQVVKTEKSELSSTKADK